jgi:hypothetical protein
VAPDIGAEFDRWVDQTVAEVMQPHISDFSTLVERLPGIYPVEVLASLKRLGTRHAQVNGMAAALTHSATVAGQALSSSGNRTKLLPPHPLDYEWRFSRTAVDVLVEASHACTEPGGPIALVGTPTIAASPEALFGRRAVTYFGVDTDALRALGSPTWLATLCNVNLLVRPSDAGTYSTVIMDPPWYEEYVRRFLWFARKITRIGGTLLLAMPPDGTRPGIVQENAQLLMWCRELGFEREAVVLARLPYDMPPFERNALRAVNIVNVHGTWRKADLWRLSKVRSTSPAWPGDMASTPWSEHRFGPVRLRINCDAPTHGEDPRLRSLIVNDILPTVSRRDRRRNEARVWTTGNRIFACDAPKILRAILEDWRHERDTVELSRDLKREIRGQIDAIVEKETRELV